jgi:hypothetical protein
MPGGVEVSVSVLGSREPQALFLTLKEYEQVKFRPRRELLDYGIPLLVS